MATYRSPDYQIRNRSVGISVQEKKFNKIFKMAAFLDFQSEWF